jgi:ABC-type multidrug transport system ATPase subunit
MEEVEALASRLVIMAAGSARCCGTPQHLKTKFGDGYTLELRVAQPPPPQQHASSDAVGVGGGGPDSGGSDAAALAAATSRAEAHFLSLLPGAVVL